MHIIITSAVQPKWMNAEQTLLNLLVKFAHLSEVVAFTASPDDVEPHGRLIFERAAAGEFGEVTEYIPPTELEIAARDNPPLRLKQMKQATEQTTHWDMMGEHAQADAWRSYYRELYALGQTPYWPLVEQWPEAPQ